MNKGKDTKSSVTAYANLLSGFRHEGSTINQINKEFLRLMVEVLKNLIEANQLHRTKEFLKDFTIFVNDMIAKYGAKESPEYALNKGHGKLQGVEIAQTKIGKHNALQRLECKYIDDEFSI